MGCVADDSGTDFHVWNHIWNLSQPPLPSIPYFRPEILRYLEVLYFRLKHIEKYKKNPSFRQENFEKFKNLIFRIHNIWEI